jgi:hypothetical protein
MYGMVSKNSALLTSQITAAAQAEASDFGANLTATPTIYYACSAAQGGTQYTVLATANNNCTGASGHTLEFIQVAASVPVALPFSCCGIPNSITLRNTSVMEVEELP